MQTPNEVIQELFGDDELLSNEFDNIDVVYIKEKLLLVINAAREGMYELSESTRLQIEGMKLSNELLKKKIDEKIIISYKNKNNPEVFPKIGISFYDFSEKILQLVNANYKILNFKFFRDKNENNIGSYIIIAKLRNAHN